MKGLISCKWELPCNTMIKLLFVLHNLCAAVAASADDAWSSFKAEHGKQYGSKAEEAARFAAFRATLRAIEAMNAARAGEHDAIFGVNKFSDLTPAEFKAAYLTAHGNTKPAIGAGRAAKEVASFHTAASRNATRVDWRSAEQRGGVESSEFSLRSSRSMRNDLPIFPQTVLALWGSGVFKGW